MDVMPKEDRGIATRVINGIRQRKAENLQDLLLYYHGKDEYINFIWTHMDFVNSALINQSLNNIWDEIIEFKSDYNNNHYEDDQGSGPE
ncbi:MAG: hypothetical protein LUH08_07080 [Ruminococcus sp.]|nr:hypothetical protein [Ruminococcus sp.]